mgnify:FL=1
MSEVYKITCPRCKKVFDAGSAFNAHIESTKKEEAKKAEALAAQKYKSQLEAKDKELEKTKKEEAKKAEALAAQKYKSQLASKDKENQKILKERNKEIEKIRQESDAKAIKEAETKFQKKAVKSNKENEINNRRLSERLDKSEKQNQEMKKLLKQKSTEVQGEVQEELIEDFLRRKFPTDIVTPIKKGERGGDCIMTLHNKNNKEIGKIYFESKDREKTFQEKWVDKLLKDMQDRNIGYGILVSTSSPKDFKKDDAYVTRHDCILVMQMNDKLIHSVVSFIKNELAIKSKNNKDFDGTAEMKRLWEFIKSDQFRIGLKGMYLKFLKIEKNIEKKKTFFEKNIADQELSLSEMEQELKNVVLSFRSKVGSILPDNLLERPKDE